MDTFRIRDKKLLQRRFKFHVRANNSNNRDHLPSIDVEAEQFQF